VRIESSVTSVSWIPSEAATGAMKLAFAAGLAHYDDPPPDIIEDLEALQAAGRFRFANRLAAWIEVEDGRIADGGYSGQGYITSTHLTLAVKDMVFQPAGFPELRPDPELGETEARFVQTTGGRTGAPLPRPVRHPPFVQWQAPTVWTTLGLTIRADGSSTHDLVGASQFPRHWIYDGEGRLVEKAGVASLQEWMGRAFGARTPWGGEDSQPIVTMAESALERQLSSTIMRGGAKPAIRRLKAGDVLVEQGQPGHELFLLLNGVISVSVDGEKLAEIGPGAVLGERALLEGGERTATLSAVTACTVAVATEDTIDRAALERLSELHRREG
jgi:hypothetical protein